MTKVLIIDDEVDMAENCARLLKPLGVKSLLSTNGKQGVELLLIEKPDLVLTDLMMPELNGMQVLNAVKEWDQDIPVIMITGYGTVNVAVEAIKGGAYDFITKPFSGDQLRVVVERAIGQRRLKEENIRLKNELQLLRYNSIIGNSTVLLKVFEIVSKVAPTDANILVTGESGTGKELVARSIHLNSRRSHRPFVAVDCAALSEELLESELFGHERGAFTGAAGTKLGLIETADGGTLFLDELGELSPRLQVKLLRVLQEKTFRRVGGTKEIEVDIRIVSATNRDLLKAIKEKTFRQDLYYRLNGITIILPPLRERAGDVSLLTKYFLAEFNKKNGLNVRLDREVLSYLEAYHWPGNIRELKNVIERAAILAEDQIVNLEDLPEEVANYPKFSPEQGLSANFVNGGMIQNYNEAKEKWLEIFEKRYLQEVLNQTNWNISRAAEEAGINRKTVHRLIKKYQINKDRM